MTRDEKFQALGLDMGYSLDGEIKVGGNYTSVVRDEKALYLSGQLRGSGRP